MSQDVGREPMLDMFIFESVQLLEQLEQILIQCEKQGSFREGINDIFRIMHTIKGSAAMMMFNNISRLAHAAEDVFYYLREQKKPGPLDVPRLLDLVLEALDFIKAEVAELERGRDAERDPQDIVTRLAAFLGEMKKGNAGVAAPAGGEKAVETPAPPAPEEPAKFYIAPLKTEQSARKRIVVHIAFEDGCEMENIRAFGLMHNLRDLAEVLSTDPEDLVGDEKSSDTIREQGFHMLLRTAEDPERIDEVLKSTLFLREYSLGDWPEDQPDFLNPPRAETVVAVPEAVVRAPAEVREREPERESHAVTKQSMISVQLSKLDKLMDLVGELVISEEMVTQHPELEGLQLESFYKAARQLRKLTNELQDVVMSVRMVPLSGTFQKMNRIVRDMCRNLGKDVELSIIGEETEVDKNIIENLSDPLMHLVRNSLDHGIESPEERRMMGKPEVGTVTLEGKNDGGDVLIYVRDDGKGLNRHRIYEKAREGGLTNKAESELTDREIYSFIMLPGFSTKEQVTEYSGRGVGMDVVCKNIEKVGGTVLISSQPGQGTEFCIKIPLTLAIIEGMEVRVGRSKMTFPITSIRESFKAQPGQVITDPDGNQMMMVRGECYPVIRLYERFGIRTQIQEIEDGIVIMVASGNTAYCLMADQLVGEQQVVVKPLPKYLKKIRGISGCSIMGDGSISLILDVGGILAG